MMLSEPRSILATEKELSREELEALIREHGQESRPESRLSQTASRPDSRAAVQTEERLEQLGVPMGPRMRILQEAKATIANDQSMNVYIL